MMVFALILAGALGAVLRFVVDAAVKHLRSPAFPWATVGINLSGAGLIGLLAGLVVFHHSSADLLSVGGTGFCGGYTTFSTAIFESIRLAEARRKVAALGNTLGTLFGSLLACTAGLELAWLVA